MNDMSSIYMSWNLRHLKIVRSQKYNKLQRLRKYVLTYSVLQEIRALEFHIKRLDAVIAAKEAQESF